MIERRNLVGGGLMAGAAALLGEGTASTAQRTDVVNMEAVGRAIDDLKEMFQRRLAVSPELSRIREQQRIFLKANQKYPDFIEVGLDVWDSVYDWHVRHQLPISMGRANDGRYVMSIMFTTLILRSEQANNYVGYAFDVR
jgi:hypothetical protein